MDFHCGGPPLQLSFTHAERLIVTIAEYTTTRAGYIIFIEAQHFSVTSSTRAEHLGVVDMGEGDSEHGDLECNISTSTHVLLHSHTLFAAIADILMGWRSKAHTNVSPRF